MTKIAVCTTFPVAYWDLCAAEMLASFSQFWPKECHLFISLDNLPEPELKATHEKILGVVKEGTEFYLSNEFDPEQIEFLKKNPHDPKQENYRFQVTRFSHKVFALHRTALHAQEAGYDYLIWLDADVITKREIKLEDLMKFLPDEKQVVSYLGRQEPIPHSECGFVGYNLKYKGASFIERMRQMYVDGSVLQLQGWTDCDVFDHLRQRMIGQEAACKNLSANLPGTHVWPLSPLGTFMEHRKGQRKVTQSPSPAPKQASPKKDLTLDNMEIRTKNCVPNDTIKEQIQQNILQIMHWVKVCKHNDEEIVIASAGPSLNRDDLMPFVERGVKIVAVKHAVERLQEWGIKPWACILLDPRPHVEAFVQKPDKDILYFVSSMVHPSVVKTLLDNKCKVIGYNALVGAGEEAVLRKDDFTVSGGSATATRSICLLHEVMGFKTFHCFGYDLCHYHRPDFQEKNDDGSQKYYEVELTALTWGQKAVKKTFVTEGQFLAQSKECADLYKSDKDIKIVLYGDGIAAWNYKHWKQYTAWANQFKQSLEKKREKSVDVNDWVKSL